MFQQWGIKQRVLFIALVPTITISILLGVYFTGIRLEDLSRALNDRGTAIATRLASQGAYGVFATDTEALRQIARHALNDEVSSVTFYDKSGKEIISAGKLQQSSRLTPPDRNAIYFFSSHQQDTLFVVVPVTLPEVMLQDLPATPDTLFAPDISATVIGSVKVELERRATRLKEYQVLIHSGLIVLLGLSISGLLALRMSYNVTQPILALAEAVEHIKQGKLNTRIQTHAHWELAILESGINTMASALQVAHQEMQSNIEQATADLRHTLETIEIQNIELELSRKEAEQASKVKSEFLASMSHELRTPLNGIIGFINLMQKTELNERQRDFLTTIQKSASNLLSIINDILDFSKIEAGKLRLDLIPMDICECVEDTLTLLAPSAHEKGLEIIPFIYSDVPQKIISDPLRIKQVITNLVSNSIKFTEQGSVIVRVMLEKETPHNFTLCISVADTGIGLSRDQQKELFHAFNQVNPNITRKFGGTGLGLVICKKLVEQMNGSIDLESEPGKGTTFWFTTMAEKVQTSAAIENKKLLGLKVLLQEPHQVAQLSLSHLLDSWGVVVQTVKHPEDILQVVQRALQEQKPFDMVLMGINQPLQHLTMIEQLKDTLKARFTCSVGLLTNTTDLLVHNEILRTGVTLCLAKPVCRRKLYDALCRIFIGTPNPEDAPSSEQAIHILAVDDNPANLKLVTTLLENIGVSVATASCGREALSIIETNKFDLILMDIHMPDIDGIETARITRNTNTINQKTPIVALTAHVMLDRQEVMRESGINDYLCKPINENQLRGTIYKWTHVGLFECDLPAQKRLPPMESELQTQAPIDWHLCMKLAGNKLALAQEMLTMLINSLPADQLAITQAIENNEIAPLGDLLHKLHGACCYVGVPKLKNLTKQLEIAASKAETEIISQHIAAFYQAIDEVIKYYHSEAFQTQIEEAVA